MAFKHYNADEMVEGKTMREHLRFSVVYWHTFRGTGSDLFYAHIGDMDAFARGLKIAAAIRQDGRLAEFVKQRYASWDSGLGAKIESGKASLQEIEAYFLKKGDVANNVSGRHEFLENLINEFI